MAAVHAAGGTSGAAFAAVCVVVVGLSWRTWVQQPVWNDSLAYWGEVVRNYPAIRFAARAWGGRGCISGKWRRRSGSLRRRSVSIRGDSTGTSARAGMRSEHGQPAEGLKSASRGLDRFGDDPDGNFYMGLALAQLGRYAEAVEFDGRAVAIMPSWPKRSYNLGNALLRSGQAREALPQYERVVTLIPDNAEYLYNYAIALMETGQDSRKYPGVERGMRIAPENPAINFAFAACASGEGDTEAAWHSLERAVGGDAALLNLAGAEPHFAAIRRSPRWGQLRTAQAHHTILDALRRVSHKPFSRSGFI